MKADDETNSLDVKGNGWIASFPFPNQTIAMDDADKDGFEESLPDESHEAGADISPGRYEFLGPGIDAGFRISANSTAGFFTLSPALACILCRANTNRDYSRYKFDLHYRGVNKLKGVISGEDYPIVGLDTERDANRVKLIKLQSTLDGTSQVDSGSLIDYLEKFIEFHKIEMPSLELNGVDSSIQAPISYQESFVPEWTKLNEELISRDANFTESAQERDDANGNSTQSTSALKELIDALASLQKAMQ